MMEVQLTFLFNKQNDKVSEAVIDTNEHMAVSYTHLDVYKRQANILPQLSNF